MATLVLSGLAKSFGPQKVLHGIDLTITDGEMVVIVGPSGCGKSTLLRLVAGLEAPSAGKIVLDGTDITRRDPAERDIAMVFQNYALYPHMSVFENMAYGLKIRRLRRAEIRKRVEEAAATLGLDGLLERKPRQLSGGQRQRVAMGRAIVREPKLFLFDEPLSNLDARLRLSMRAEIHGLQRRLGTTSLYVTHDQVEAMTLGDRLVVMHEGRSAQVAEPMEIFSHPADTYVAGFIGAPAMNFLPARLADEGRGARLDTGPDVAFADGARAGPEGRRIIIGIRPEHVRLDPSGIALKVELVEPLGSETLVHGKLADGTRLVVKVVGGAPKNAALGVAFPSIALHVFDAESGARLEPLAGVAEPLAEGATGG